MVEELDMHDPWQVYTNGFLPNIEDVDAIRIETVTNVKPLDRQFGVSPKKTVPDALREALFGQPEAAKAPAGDSSEAQNLQTYAVLDAAKVVNLPELLGASELEYRCLFKGAAYDEMKNAAPWVVRLEDGNGFTRRLFTGPEGINGLWDKEAGIYVRSYGTLDEIWRHFRKFTRVQDENGKWYYFRFWEFATLDYLASASGVGLARRLKDSHDFIWQGETGGGTGTYYIM